MKKNQKFLSEKLPFLVVKFSVYLIRRVFVMLLFLGAETGGFEFIKNISVLKKLTSDSTLLFTFFCRMFDTTGSLEFYLKASTRTQLLK